MAGPNRGPIRGPIGGLSGGLWGGSTALPETPVPTPCLPSSLLPNVPLAALRGAQHVVQQKLIIFPDLVWPRIGTVLWYQ